MAKNATKNTSNKMLTKRTRRARRLRDELVYRGLPTSYPNAPGDQARINFKTTSLIGIAPATSITTGLIVLGQGTSVTGITYLNSVSALFAANIGCYSKYMVESLTVELRATGVGGSANTFVAASYIPSNTSHDAVPTNLSEVSQSNNYAESALGTVGKFTVRPCEYYNDWRNTNNADDADQQAGLIQIYGSGSSSSAGETAGVITISGVVHFCGLRT